MRIFVNFCDFLFIIETFETYMSGVDLLTLKIKNYCIVKIKYVRQCLSSREKATTTFVYNQIGDTRFRKQATKRHQTPVGKASQMTPSLTRRSKKLNDISLARKMS